MRMLRKSARSARYGEVLAQLALGEKFALRVRS